VQEDRERSPSIAEQLRQVEEGPVPAAVPTGDEVEPLVEPFVPSREDVERAVVATARREGRSVKSVRTTGRHERCQECGAWLRRVGADEQRIYFRCGCGRSFPARQLRMVAMERAAERAGRDYIEL
jgi:hypothetical protein